MFLCGFNGEEKEKLTKILTNACATRFDEYDSRVEYVIVGQPNGADVQLISGLNIRYVLHTDFRKLLITSV